MKIAEGRTVRGHKIGLTSRAMQVASQITEPDFGTLLDDMFFAEGGDIPLQRFILPRVEVELAFVLNKPLRGEPGRPPPPALSPGGGGGGGGPSSKTGAGGASRGAPR